MNVDNFLFSALVIGFLGSFHCVAMCGPIALALSGGTEDKLAYIAGRVIYNAGRITTYAVLGLTAGSIGHTFLLAGFQKSISIITGILMIAGVFFVYWNGSRFNIGSPAVKLNFFIKSIFKNVIHKRTRISLYIAGMANGILPCGFVYIALAGAAITQQPLNGVAYMVLFGLGTFPAMMAVSMFGKVAGIKARDALTRATPVLMIVLGLVLIFRGVQMKDNQCCHHPVSKHQVVIK
ncbi:MAG TPA: sulfite exporter TauE/SafE family protein [Bacteroidia bacterium]|nr:sulfite exporter TauE/SafE family protein [Bacteroidia bacterium]